MSSVRRAPALLVLPLLASVAIAESELLREEPFNYRVVGRLPKGWKRQGVRLAYTFRIDDIPHAYVHFARQRVGRDIDVAEEMAKREPHYRFPGVPEEAKGTWSKALWGGQEARLYEFRADVKGVASYRRVTAMAVRGVWYELIETVYGDKTLEQAACREGLEVFRAGFRLLVAPLPPGAEKDVEERTLRSDEYGYEIIKPKGFLRIDVNTGADPGCRLQFERIAGNGRQHARVRLFEYAQRDSVDVQRWLDIFFTNFAAHHNAVDRAKEDEPPKVPGARMVAAERFTGTRDKLPVRTLVLIVHAESGRVFVLRIRTQADADEIFAAGLRQVLVGFRVK